MADLGSLDMVVKDKGGQISASVEETNRVRAALGMAPLSGTGGAGTKRPMPPAGRGRGGGAGCGGGGSDRARFVRDEHGDIVVVKSGEKTPAEIEAEREKSAEELHYEAYLEGRSSGAVRRIGGFSDGIDKAAAVDSSYAREAEERERSGEAARQHAPARAHNRGHKFKDQRHKSAGESAGRVGVRAFDQAMARARAVSDDDDDEAMPSAAVLCDRAMRAYNEQVSGIA